MLIIALDFFQMACGSERVSSINLTQFYTEEYNVFYRSGVLMTIGTT